ncbi:MAG: hypothetical protein ACOYB1_09775 [Limnohabitans sp.]
MSAHTLIKGIPLTLGAVTYTLPPASLGTLEANVEQLDKINAAFAGTAEFSLRDMLFVADFATACLRRNYPEIDRQLVAEHVGLDNVLDVLQMCLDTSGLMRKKLESDVNPAAASEGGTLGESAGTASSPTS